MVVGMDFTQVGAEYGETPQAAHSRGTAAGSKVRRAFQ
jgi:hypothetical protein